MRFIICYDVSDDKKRNKLSKKLKAYGIRTQYSVFEVEAEKHIILKLLEEVDSILDPVDKFFVYYIDNQKVKELTRMGIAETGEILHII